ncbi:MAG: polysaccharide biosynthesis C-terminal domain-containing protein [Saprospiraceae bacterium]|nr:polysaccharide biosynthesis C-terminal domain-containing protein [Saprospiraceae bacterium]
MGVIARQSFKDSLVRYAGVGIGAISTLFIFPLALKEIGLIRFLISTALLFMPFASFSTTNLGIRFFPSFRDKERNNNGFLGLLIAFSTLSFLLFTLVVFLFKGAILKVYSGKEDLFLNHLFYFLPICFLLIQINVLTSYTSNFQRIVVPTIANDFLHKITLPILILLFYFQHLSIIELIWGVILTHVANLLILVAYLAYLGEFSLKLDFKYLNRQLISQMSNYGFFSLLGSLGGIFATQIDVFMVGSLLDTELTGTFSILLFVASTISVPKRAMDGVTSPLVAQAWKSKDLNKIDDLYKKTSTNLFLVGSFLLALIWFNFPDLTHITPNGEKLLAGQYVILLIGGGLIVDMITSINGFIINFSPFYKFGFYSIIILGILNIVLNFLLIPVLGINGAALATFLSLIIYNAFKVGYVKIKFGLSPFTSKIPVIIMGVAIMSLIGMISPVLNNPFLSIGLRSTLMVLFFGIYTLSLAISPDLNDFVINKLPKGWIKKK